MSPSLFQLMLPMAACFLFSLLPLVRGDECGTRFTDTTSSTVLAQVVIKGSVVVFNPMTLPSNRRSANVTVGGVYKGMELLKTMRQNEDDVIVVSDFGNEDRENCVASDSAITIAEPRIFFLRKSSARNTLQLSAMPMEAEGSVEKRIRRSLCPTCIRPPVIRRIRCKDCAVEPAIKAMKSKKVKMGKRAKLRCSAKGVPTPEFSWSKADVPIISGSGGVTIRNTATSSTLIITRTMSAHDGQYKCVAKNDIGHDEQFVTLEITKATQTPKYTFKNVPDKRECSSILCLNGGTCYTSDSLYLSVCECTAGFEGVRCENVVDEGETVVYDDDDYDDNNQDDNDGGDGNNHGNDSSTLQRNIKNSSQTIKENIEANVSMITSDNPSVLGSIETGGLLPLVRATQNVSIPTVDTIRQTPVRSNPIQQSKTSSTVHGTTLVPQLGVPVPFSPERRPVLPGTGLSRSRSNRPQQVYSRTALRNAASGQPAYSQTNTNRPSRIKSPTILPTSVSLTSRYIPSTKRRIKDAKAKASKSHLKIVHCLEKGYCLHGGRCKYIRKLDRKFCQCLSGYSGKRCEFIV